MRPRQTWWQVDDDWVGEWEGVREGELEQGSKRRVEKACDRPARRQPRPASMSSPAVPVVVRCRSRNKSGRGGNAIGQQRCRFGRARRRLIVRHWRCERQHAFRLVIILVVLILFRNAAPILLVLRQCRLGRREKGRWEKGHEGSRFRAANMGKCRSRLRRSRQPTLLLPESGGRRPRESCQQRQCAPAFRATSDQRRAP